MRSGTLVERAVGSRFERAMSGVLTSVLVAGAAERAVGLAQLPALAADPPHEMPLVRLADLRSSTTAGVH